MKSNLKPLVSIVTSVYNGEKYLRETIKSIREQSYENIEYIIIDGGSNDSTCQIINENIDIVSKSVSETDRGMYDALNKGFDLASGDIYYYLNSDDILETNAVESAVKMMSASITPIVVGDCLHIDQCGNILCKYKGVPLGFGEACCLGRIPFAQQSAFWSAKIHKSVGGFDPGLRYVGDTKFFYSILQRINIKPLYLDQVVARFRQHDQALSSKCAVEMGWEHDKLLTEIGYKKSIRRFFLEARFKWINRRAIIIKRVPRYFR